MPSTAQSAATSIEPTVTPNLVSGLETTNALDMSRAATWRVAVVATLVMSVSYIDRQTLAAIAPTVREALHIDTERYGWLTSAFSMSYLVGAPLAGILIDKIGARRGLTVALLVWSAIAGMHALATSFAILVALRIALGASESPSFPGATQTIRRVLARGDRSAGFGLLFTGSSIGAMIAPPLALALNALNPRWGFRLAFVGTAVVGLAWLPLWLYTTRAPGLRARLTTRDASRPRVTVRGFFRLAATAPVLRAIVLVVASAPAIMFVLNFAPLYLVDAHGVTQNGLAKYLWAPPLFFDAGAVVFGMLASRRDRRASAASAGLISHWPLVCSAAVLASALAFAPLVHSAWPAVFLASISLAGGGALFALLTGDMLARVDASQTSTAGGLTAAAQSLAYVIASPLVGRVVKQTHSYDSVLVTLGALAIPGALIWTFWPMNQPSRSTPADASSAAT